MEEEYYVKGNEDMGAVEEIWESYGGSLWLITEVDEDGFGFGYARLSHCPQFAEWGVINRPELQSDGTIWRVTEGNWMNINTYEDGLLVEG